MKKGLQILIFALLPFLAAGQVVKTAAVTYTKGASPYTPNIASSSEIRIDTAASQVYWWDRDNLTWRIFRPGADVISGGSPPAYTPRDNQSLFAVNADSELYYWNGSAWNEIGGGSGTGENMYNTDDLLKAGGTTVGLDSGSLKLQMATTAAATRYGLEIIASDTTAANRFISMRTNADSIRIQEASGEHSITSSTDLQFNIADQLRFVADSIQFFEGSVATTTAVPFLYGLTSSGWAKRYDAVGNSGKALVSNGTNWLATTVVTSADGNGIYTGSGNVPDGTVATLDDDFAFSGGDISSFTATTGVTNGGEYFSNLQGASVYMRDTAGNSVLEITGTGASFTFNDGTTDRLTINTRDARYGADYSATYSIRSLVDKGYVDSHTGGLTLGSANQIFGVNAGGTANEYKTLSGTANQVTVTHGVGTVTLATPQDIHTGATPTFSDLTLTDDLFVTDDATFGSATINLVTIAGNSLSRLLLTGSSVIDVGDATAGAQVNINGTDSDISFQTGTGAPQFTMTSEAASGTTAADAPFLQFYVDDGAALTNAHRLGTLQFQSRGSTSVAETGAQISALADGADWTGASNPTKLELAVVPSGSDVLDIAHTIRATGQHEFNNYGSGTFTGTPAYALQVTATGQIIEGSVSAAAGETNAPPTIYPAQIAATTNDYSPTGYSTTVSQTIQVDGDGSFRTITGMAAATRNGVEKTFDNDGANCYIIAKQHTGSSAANRFNISQDIILMPNMVATFRYDSVGQRWRTKSINTSNVIYNNYVKADLLTNTTDITSGNTDSWTWTANGGTWSNNPASTTTPSNLRTISGATTTAATAFPTMTTKDRFIFLNSGVSYIRVATAVRASALSTAAEDYDFRIGFRNTQPIDTNSTEGAWINYEYQENSGNFTVKSNDNSTTSTNNSAVAMSTTVFKTLELIYYPYGEIVAFIDGERVAATNIPTSLAVWMFVTVDKDNGTTTRSVFLRGITAEGYNVSESN